MPLTVILTIPHEFRLAPDDPTVVHHRSNPEAPWSVWGVFPTEHEAFHTVFVLRKREADVARDSAERSEQPHWRVVS